MSENRHLVLLGGGHANLHVLDAFKREPLHGVRVTLVSPYRTALYSGMMPGLIAGHYSLDACSIALDRLAEAAGAEFLCTRARDIEPAARCVRLADGWTLDYDLLAIDIGSDVRTNEFRCASDRMTPVRPAQSLAEQCRTWMHDRLEEPIAIIGGGMAGIEIACALRVASGHRAAVVLVTGRHGIVPTQGEALRRRLCRALQARGVRMVVDDVNRIDDTDIETTSGQRFPASLVILATGPQAPELLRRSGLEVDAGGYLKVDAFLRSTGDPSVFAAGDCASLLDSNVARSGVYAVRAGPVLAHNLRAALMGQALQTFRPQPRTLNLISTGTRYAIAAWGRWSWEGAWVWRWKRRIDSGFVRRFSAR